jgi:hypothetical protein
MSLKTELESDFSLIDQAKRFKPDQDKDVVDFVNWCTSMSMFIDFEKVIKNKFPFLK